MMTARPKWCTGWVGRGGSKSHQCDRLQSHLHVAQWWEEGHVLQGSHWVQRSWYLVHSPKSIPSDTLPRATDSRMAPRPFSQAWGGVARQSCSSQSRLLGPSPHSPSPAALPAPPPPTYLLVLLQGDTGLSPILGLNEEQLVPLDVFKDALGTDTRQVKPWLAGRMSSWASWLNPALPQTPRQQPPASSSQRREGWRVLVSLTSWWKPWDPSRELIPTPHPLDKWGRDVGQDGQLGQPTLPPASDEGRS